MPRTITAEYGEIYFHGATVREWATMDAALDYRYSINGNMAETRRHVTIIANDDARTDDQIIRGMWDDAEADGSVYHG